MTSMPVVLSLDEVEAWGRRIGAEAEPPLLIALHGPLGAGKSVLARAIARGAGVTGPVPSPTYNLMLAYEADRNVRLIHIDLYRLHHADEVAELGWDEVLSDARGIVVVEWAERAGRHLPEQRCTIRMDQAGQRPDLRRVEWWSSGGAPDLPTPCGPEARCRG